MLLQEGRLGKAEMILGSTIEQRSSVLGQGSPLVMSCVLCEKEATAYDALLLSHIPSLLPQHQWSQEGIFNVLCGTLCGIFSLTYSGKLGFARANSQGRSAIATAFSPLHFRSKSTKMEVLSNDSSQHFYKCMCI